MTQIHNPEITGSIPKVVKNTTGKVETLNHSTMYGRLPLQALQDYPLQNLPLQDHPN